MFTSIVMKLKKVNDQNSNQNILLLLLLVSEMWKLTYCLLSVSWNENIYIHTYILKIPVL